ncbi:MAG: acyltransferase [Clostridiaceae bacterium]
MNRERLTEIDALRALAFIFVVVQHTLGGFSNIKGIPYASYIIMKLMYIMAKPAVPIFLFISALVLIYAHKERLNLKNYYLKRIKFIFIPYIIWSAISMYKLGNEERFANFIAQLIAGNAAYHFWYMGMVIRMFLYFPIILWIAKKIHAMNIQIRTAVFLLLVCLYYYISGYQSAIVQSVAALIFGTPDALELKMLNISIFFWYLYFILGIYMALNYKYIKAKLLEYKAAVFVCYGISYAYAFLNEIHKVPFVRPMYLMYVVMSIAAFYLISIMIAGKKFAFKPLKFIGDYSFAAYMAHVIVIQYAANRIMLELHTSNYLIVGFLTLFITVVATPVIIKLFTYLPYSEYVTGLRRSSPDLFKTQNS